MFSDAGSVLVPLVGRGGCQLVGDTSPPSSYFHLQDSIEAGQESHLPFFAHLLGPLHTVSLHQVAAKRCVCFCTGWSAWPCCRMVKAALGSTSKHGTWASKPAYLSGLQEVTGGSGTKNDPWKSRCFEAIHCLRQYIATQAEKKKEQIWQKCAVSLSMISKGQQEGENKENVDERPGEPQGPVVHGDTFQGEGKKIEATWATQSKIAMTHKHNKRKAHGKLK